MKLLNSAFGFILAKGKTMSDDGLGALDGAISDVEDKIVAINAELAALSRQKEALVECRRMLGSIGKCQRLLDAQKNVVVVGAKGAMGGLFCDFFSRHACNVIALDKEDWPPESRHFDEAHLVLLSVPIDKLRAVVESLPPLPADCILADITSVKQEPLACMLAHHPGPVLGLHPMFGPTVESVKEQVVVVCHGRKEAHYQWLLDTLSDAGAFLTESTGEEHDSCMIFVQALRHFSTFTYGLFLQQCQIDLDNLLAFSSPIYRLELSMVGRLFAQDPHLYSEIIFGSQENVATIGSYIDSLQRAFCLLERGDKDGFKRQFQQVNEWMGDLTGVFLKESNVLLESSRSQLNDLKKNDDQPEQKRKFPTCLPA